MLSSSAVHVMTVEADEKQDHILAACKFSLPDQR